MTISTTSPLYLYLTRIFPEDDVSGYRPSLTGWDLYHELTLIDSNRTQQIEEEIVEVNNTLNPFTNTWYTCDKCGKKESAVDFAQTRRADEGISSTILCICGNKFTING